MVEERTQSVRSFWKNRKLNPDSNVQFGEGGAGTFSDGKLTTGIKDSRCREVFVEFCENGAPKEIMYSAKPHIGTDRLRQVVKNIRGQIENAGGEVRFHQQVTDIEVAAGKLVGVVVNGGTVIPCSLALFGIGHSARDTYQMLYDRGVAMEAKAFAIGVRIEHPQELIDHSQYGCAAADLGLDPADYALVYHVILGVVCASTLMIVPLHYDSVSQGIACAACALAGLDSALDQLPQGLDTVLGKLKEGGQDLSGGEWQRLAMARALVNPAPLRILDEPTAALDPISESRLYKQFEQMSRGHATIFISHRLGSTQLADRIYVLEGGKAVEEGSHAELLQAGGVYAAMFESQRSWYQ